AGHFDLDGVEGKERLDLVLIEMRGHVELLRLAVHRARSIDEIDSGVGSRRGLSFSDLMLLDGLAEFGASDFVGGGVQKVSGDEPAANREQSGNDSPLEFFKIIHG